MQEKDYVRRRRSLLLSVILVALFALVLSSCNAKEKNAIKDFGQSNAYDKSLGIDFTLSGGVADYYLPITLPQEYIDISKYAAEKATATSSKITITYGSNSSSSFSFAVNYAKGNGLNAKNDYTFMTLSAKITGSTITYNMAYMDGYDIQTKTHIALHEMGHTLGLGHITDSRMRTQTVMYNIQDNTDNLTDYTDFDKYNITWKYGE